MSNKRFFARLPAGRFWLALVLSGLAHLWLFSGLNFTLPRIAREDAPIVVRLVQLPVPVAKIERTPPAVRPVPKVQPTRKPVPQPKTPLPTTVETSTTVEPPVEPVMQVPLGDIPPPLRPKPPAETLAPPDPVTDPPPVDAVPEEEAALPVPRHVEIDFQIVRKGGVAGIERHQYQQREDGTYLLRSVAEPKGLLALALSDLVQISEGHVTSSGLQPMQYVYQYGRNTDKAQRAYFDWQAGILLMTHGAKQNTVELQPGTQDLLSFMYQFMFVPPLQDMRLAITNGKRLRIYDYGFEGEETLQTTIGPLRTFHIGRSSSDDEKTELWLAVDYHYLPVKISKTEKDGTVTERIATRIKAE